jgi:hypothetical protein
MLERRGERQGVELGKRWEIFSAFLPTIVIAEVLSS